MRYFILDAFSPSELSERVEEYLHNGWDLYGTLTIAIWNNKVIFCQAVTCG
jgi:hypothetical protein